MDDKEVDVFPVFVHKEDGDDLPAIAGCPECKRRLVPRVVVYLTKERAVDGRHGEDRAFGLNQSDVCREEDGNHPDSQFAGDFGCTFALFRRTGKHALVFLLQSRART